MQYLGDIEIQFEILQYIVVIREEIEIWQNHTLWQNSAPETLAIAKAFDELYESDYPAIKANLELHEQLVEQIISETYPNFIGYHIDLEKGVVHVY